MNTPHKFHIAQKEHVVKRVEELNRRSEDIKSRLGPTLKKLWKTERELGQVQNIEVFQSLKTRFPNFIEVIDLYEATAIGLSSIGQPFEATPILLGGDPGLGKTYFVSELAKAMEFAFYEISMATVTAGFALTGGNIQWNEGEIGYIAKSLANSPIANPIILLDEIDKTSGSHNHKPMNALYGLLEPHSAKRFKDEAIEIEMDISRVIWIATANYLEAVPAPILSRMKVINIRNPSEQEMVDVIKSVYLNVKNSKPYGAFFDDEIDDQVIELMTHISPRDARKAIDDGLLRAIRDQRTKIQPRDIKLSKKSGGNRVGFL